MRHPKPRVRSPRDSSLKERRVSMDERTNGLGAGRSDDALGHRVMADPHLEFFERLDWFGREDCERLPEELAWSRRECPVVHSAYDGGQYVVTRYDDLRTIGQHPEVFSSSTPGVQRVPVPVPPLDLDPPLH